MSQAETAVQNLRQSLAELIPTLLNNLSSFRQQHEAQPLLSSAQTFATISPIVAASDVGKAFRFSSNSLGDPSGNIIERSVRDLCLEICNNELRKLVSETSSTLSDFDFAATELSHAALRSTFDRLDVTLALSLNNYTEQALPLILMEELIEVNTVSMCSQLFSYIESRVKQLTVNFHPKRGKGLVLLRTCNELLRRLSKPSKQHSVFAGRILSLLAAVVPLGDDSSVNLRGDFNVENTTIIEEPSSTSDDALDNVVQQSGEDDDKDAVFKVDYPFYELFWKVQRIFSDPSLLMASISDSSRPPTRPPTRSASPALDTRPDDDGQSTEEDPAPEGAKGPMSELRIATKKIIELFSAVAKREKELAGANAAEAVKEGIAHGTNHSHLQTSSGPNNSIASQLTTNIAAGDVDAHRTKRPRIAAASGNAAMTSIKDNTKPGDPTPGDNAVQEGQVFFPKYLTGKKLFEYEIRDTSFRKHILLQYLVLFQFLLSFSPLAKVTWKDWKNKKLQSPFTLDDADERWIRRTWRELQALIRDMQPDGRIFLDTMLEVLKRETNWIRWKVDSCPSIEKPPMSPEQIAEFASARTRLHKEPAEFPHKLGTAALSELWQDSLPPPEKGTRMVEDEMGNEVEVSTDGLEELEISPPIPSLIHYQKAIKREEMKINMRKKQLGIDPDVAPTQLNAEERLKLDQDESIQAIIESKQSLAWRALRIASRDNLHLFGQMDPIDSIEKLLEAMKTEREPTSKRKSHETVETQIGSEAERSEQDQNIIGTKENVDNVGDDAGHATVQKLDLTEAGLDTPNGQTLQQDSDAVNISSETGDTPQLKESTTAPLSVLLPEMTSADDQTTGKEDQDVEMAEAT